jgi:feruloyl esterase
MFFPLSSLALSLFITTGHSSPVNETFSSKCTSFASSLHLNNYSDFQVTISEYLATNSTLNLTAEGWNETCAAGDYNSPPPIPVNLCRVGLTVATSNSSEVILETWLPENWNGRFLSTGNGGLAGCKCYFTTIIIIININLLCTRKTRGLGSHRDR